jgi:hypothetical protein
MQHNQNDDPEAVVLVCMVEIFVLSTDFVQVPIYRLLSNKMPVNRFFRFCLTVSFKNVLIIQYHGCPARHNALLCLTSAAAKRGKM